MCRAPGGGGGGGGDGDCLHQKGAGLILQPLTSLCLGCRTSGVPGGWGGGGGGFGTGEAHWVVGGPMDTHKKNDYATKQISAHAQCAKSAAHGCSTRRLSHYGAMLVKGRYAGNCLPSVFKGDFHSGL